LTRGSTPFSATPSPPDPGKVAVFSQLQKRVSANISYQWVYWQIFELKEVGLLCQAAIFRRTATFFTSHTSIEICEKLPVKMPMVGNS
jgi:hypothetical protein